MRATLCALLVAVLSTTAPKAELGEWIRSGISVVDEGGFDPLAFGLPLCAGLAPEEVPSPPRIGCELFFVDGENGEETWRAVLLFGDRVVRSEEGRDPAEVPLSLEPCWAVFGPRGRFVLVHSRAERGLCELVDLDRCTSEQLSIDSRGCWVGADGSLMSLVPPLVFYDESQMEAGRVDVSETRYAGRSEDGEYAFAVGGDPPLRVFDRAGNEVWQSGCEDGAISGLPTFTPEGEYLIIPRPNRVQCFRSIDGSPLWEECVDGLVENIVCASEYTWAACVGANEQAHMFLGAAEATGTSEATFPALFDSWVFGAILRVSETGVVLGVASPISADLRSQSLQRFFLVGADGELHWMSEAFPLYGGSFLSHQTSLNQEPGRGWLPCAISSRGDRIAYTDYVRIYVARMSQEVGDE